ncbi:MAG: hypothetical protein ACRYFK_03775 [Janthinobacterium lividum]
MKKLLYLASALGISLLAASPALAQVNQTPPPTGPTFEAPAGSMPSDEQSYRREVVFGINFNTQGGLIGGANVRVASVLDERLLRFWSLEGVSFKNPKEERVTNPYTGGTYTRYKTNYAFALRPSFGLQRILFRKAAESGVQVNGLLSAGPSIAFLMPYYISFDYDAQHRRQFGPSDIIVNEQYDPTKHAESDFIVDRAPLFTGIAQTKVVAGGHLRGGLSFEYGRYRDAVAGAEVGFLLELYTKRLDVLAPPAPTDPNTLNKQFYPSVYLTLYLGHRS